LLDLDFCVCVFGRFKISKQEEKKNATKQLPKNYPSPQNNSKKSTDLLATYVTSLLIFFTQPLVLMPPLPALFRVRVETHLPRNAHKRKQIEGGKGEEGGQKKSYFF
jgi:hypothetical protein